MPQQISAEIPTLAVCSFGENEVPSTWKIVLCILTIISFSIFSVLTICGIIERRKFFKYLTQLENQRNGSELTRFTPPSSEAGGNGRGKNLPDTIIV
jgi:amino acid permease